MADAVGQPCGVHLVEQFTSSSALVNTLIDEGRVAPHCAMDLLAASYVLCIGEPGNLRMLALHSENLTSTCLTILDTVLQLCEIT